MSSKVITDEQYLALKKFILKAVYDGTKARVFNLIAVAVPEHNVDELRTNSRAAAKALTLNLLDDLTRSVQFHLDRYWAEMKSEEKGSING